MLAFCISCGGQLGNSTPTGSPTPTQQPLDPAIIAALVDPEVIESGMYPPNFLWALDNVNAAGGVAGRALQVEFIATEEDLEAQAEEIASDERYVAAIAPPGSTALATMADAFIDHKKVLISATSAAADLLRAHGGSGYIWRTRESDVAQVEATLRYAKERGATSVALLTSLEDNAYTFFSWFGFFAIELGFQEDAVSVHTLDPEACGPSLVAALEPLPDVLVLAPASPQEQACLMGALPPSDMPRPTIVVADTGLDPYNLTDFPTAEGVEGLAAFGDQSYALAWAEREGEDHPPAPHGPSEYDALLFLAYGLEVSEGAGGSALATALKEVADGREEGIYSWDAEGIAEALGALSRGERPLLTGATGAFAFEPGLYMDLAASLISRWRITEGALEVVETIDTASDSFLTSEGALVGASEENISEIGDSSWEPEVEKGESWALVMAFSVGWDNYRHQADALRQYQYLKAQGMDDDHIILILADDIAQAPENLEPGTVRNEPGGPNLNTEVVIDYNLDLTPEMLVDILLGRGSDALPEVLNLDDASNLYLYLVGHGGTRGISIGGVTVEAGLVGSGAFSPDHLREALCTLQSEERLRRSLILIESCYAGAFGEASYGGLEAGCDGEDATVPLNGAALITAANAVEVSYAGSYDRDLGAWVSDEFSEQAAALADADPSTDLFNLYVDTYLGVSGSHTSLYNTSAAGNLSLISLDEFTTP